MNALGSEILGVAGTARIPARELHPVGDSGGTTTHDGVLGGGNAFAGKYESVFCVNRGSREERMQALLHCVRTVYASALSEKALQYRVRRGLLDRDEQMALLVMRVSGNQYLDKFFPHIAGVGLSHNPYVWHKYIDPRAGVLRLVFGLGTRAVDRADEDYTRLIALNAPQRRPESNVDEVREYSQRRLDFLDLAENRLRSGHFLDLVEERLDLPLELVASCHRTTLPTSEKSHYVLTFDGLLNNTSFVDDMRTLLRTLEDAYQHPVDIEFAANFLADQQYRISRSRSPRELRRDRSHCGALRNRGHARGSRSRCLAGNAFLQ